MQCPVGKFSSSFSNTDVSDCVPCTPGYHCATPGLATVTALCPAGYFCSGGTYTAAPVRVPGSGLPDPGGDLCPAGYACPLGSVAPIPCGNGTFSGDVGAANCTSCPGGYYCNNATVVTPTECTAGSYCVSGSSSPRGCPIGTYNTITSAANASQCLECPPGHFCDLVGLNASGTPCAAGYYCSGRTINSFGGVDGSPFPLVCPAGFHCPAGSGVPTACPAGRYSPSSSLTSVSQCSLCDEGWYCNTSALTRPTGQCLPGYYCRFSVSMSAPTGGVSVVSFNGSANVSIGGAICPAGYLCRAGTSVPTPCVAGSYNAVPGSSESCTVCPRGFYCLEGASSYTR